MSYETAPATQLVATDCACCGRPLVDAVSVETGIGPVCREKYGFLDEVTSSVEALAEAQTILGATLSIEGLDARSAANKIVHFIAAHESDAHALARCQAGVALVKIGFVRLAARLCERETERGAINVEAVGATLEVRTPFSERFNENIRSLRGVRWDAARKVRIVPHRSFVDRIALWRVLEKSFPAGTLVRGSKGCRVLGGAS